jgi:hypothetical protein
MKTSATTLADTAIGAETALGTDGAAASYETNYRAKNSGNAKGYTTLLTAAKTTADPSGNGSDGKFDTWKTAVGTLEKAEQMYDRLNSACASSKGMLGKASGDYRKTCTKFMSGFAEWTKQKLARGDKGTAAVAPVGA